MDIKKIILNALVYIQSALDGIVRYAGFFLLSACLWNFFLCRDRLSSDVPPTLGAALLCSSRVGSDPGLYPDLVLRYKRIS